MPYESDGEEYDNLADYYDATRKPTKNMKIQRWREDRRRQFEEQALMGPVSQDPQMVNEEGDVQPPSEIVWDRISAKKNRRLLSFTHGCGSCGCGNGADCSK